MNSSLNYFDHLGLIDDQRLRMINALVKLKDGCCVCPKIVTFADCMFDTYVSDNLSDEINDILNGVLTDLGEASRRVDRVRQLDNAFEFIQGIRSGQIIGDSSRQAVYNRLGNVIGNLNRAASLGESLSRLDAADFLLTIGNEFGPPGLNSMTGFYREAYRDAKDVIENIALNPGQIRIIEQSVGFCEQLSDCDSAEIALSSGFNNPCKRHLR